MTKLIDGKPRTLESIILQYRGLIHHLAIRYVGEYDKDDLVSEGYLGLMRAYDRYNPEVETLFVTYARKMIVSYMLKLKRKPAQGLHFPHEIVLLGWAIDNNDWQDKPIDFIAYALNKPSEHVERALYYLQARTPERMDKFVREDDDSSMHDTIGRWGDFTQIYVTDFINTLDDREKAIVQCLYQEMPQREIGEIIGFSQMQVSRFIKRIREKYQEYNLGVVS